jgi:GMP synthase-like glutamine amidotransferase
MKPIRIFRHINCEGPGYLATVLEKNNIPFEFVRIDAGESPPPQIDDVSAVVFMGGPMSVNDNLAWIHQELAVIKKAIDADIPVLGHCLGGQLISKALGGEVSSNPVKEIGWLPVQKIQNKPADEWLGTNINDSLAFHWHGETFSIPKGATAILKSQHCAHQGFVIGKTLALQYHVEMTSDMVREWVSLYKNELSEPSETVQAPEVIIENLEHKVSQLQKTADALYHSWLQPIINH